MPGVASKSDGGATTICGASTTSTNGKVPESPYLSVDVTEKLNVPDAVGVPFSSPIELNDNPAGSAPLASAYVYGAEPLLVENVTSYGFAYCPSGSDAVTVSGVTGTEKLNARVVVWLAESVTLTENVQLPTCDGVPVSVPEE